MTMLRKTFVLALAAASWGLSAEAPKPATLLLVRHAERSGPETNDPITAAGQIRAQLIAQMFADANISTIVVSDAIRTQQTAAPLAALRKIKPVVIDRAKGASNEALLDAFSTLKPGSVTFAVRHGGEIEKVIERLGGGTLPAISEQEYSRLLVVSIVDGKAVSVATLRYGSK
jgi:phosphohistidine phosphatase SixA